MAEGERTKWTDFALDQRVAHVDNVLDALSKMPDTVARMAVAQDALTATLGELRDEMREIRNDATKARDEISVSAAKARDDISADFRRVWERLDGMRVEQGARDREYRRNIVIALGPLGLAALGIIAKLVGVGLPG